MAVEPTKAEPVVTCRCSQLFNCCDCGHKDSDEGDGCGCRYCWSCNACEKCLEENDP